MTERDPLQQLLPVQRRDGPDSGELAAVLAPVAPEPARDAGPPMLREPMLREPMLREPITGARAWTRASLDEHEWRVVLGPDALHEIAGAARRLRRARLPIWFLDAADFELDACRAALHDARRRLIDGAQFCVIDRLPVDLLDEEETRAIYWLLAGLLSRPVAQKHDGTMIFEVRDLGQPQRPGAGIRGTVTNAEMTFHNDNSFNDLPPHFVSLLCLRPAQRGGASAVTSFYTVHNRLLADAPGSLERLYRPVWWDRHREHAPEDPPCVARPPFRWDGTSLAVRYGIFNIRSGAAMRGEALDPALAIALDDVQAIFDDPSAHVDFELKPGQIQIVNNRTTGHARTAFDDPPGKPGRHLVRLWLRDEGRRTYDGC